MEKYRIAAHEICHAIIALLYGYKVIAVRYDGPPHNPGLVEREIPGGKDGNDPEWARKELALFCAGYEGEIVVFGGFEPRFQNSNDPESDWHMVDQCAIVALDIEEDILALNATQGSVPRHKWREGLPKLRWAEYDKLIEQAEGEVAELLARHKSAILPLAEILYKKRRLTGTEFEELFAPYRVV
jgi:hypothetical protein